MPAKRAKRGMVATSEELDFLPGTASAGFLSEEQVQDRKEKCTADQLAKLQASPAFKQWKTVSEQRRNWQPFQRHKWTFVGAGSAVVVFTLLALATSSGRTWHPGLASAPSTLPAVTPVEADVQRFHIARAEAVHAKAQLADIQQQLQAATRRANELERGLEVQRTELKEQQQKADIQRTQAQTELDAAATAQFQAANSRAEAFEKALKAQQDEARQQQQDAADRLQHDAAAAAQLKAATGRLKELDQVVNQLQAEASRQQEAARQQQHDAAARLQQVQAQHQASTAATASGSEAAQQQLLAAKDSELALIRQQLEQFQASEQAAAAAAAAKQQKEAEQALTAEASARAQLQAKLDSETELRKTAENAAEQAKKDAEIEAANAKAANAAQEKAARGQADAKAALKRAASSAGGGAQARGWPLAQAPPAWAAEHFKSAVQRAILRAQSLSLLRLLAEAVALMVTLCVTAALLPWHWLADDTPDAQQAGVAEEALQQLRGAHHDLAVAQQQLHSSAAHAATLELQLQQARDALRATSAGGGEMAAQQEAFQRQLLELGARETRLLSQVEEAEAWRQERDALAEQLSAAKEAVGEQAAQNAEARRSLETRDMEHAEVLHSLQELQASLQAAQAATAAAKEEAEAAQQEQEAAQRQHQEALAALADQKTLQERKEKEMQEAAAAAAAHAESLASDKATLVRHLAAAQARLNNAPPPTPRRTASIGSGSQGADGGHLTSATSGGGAGAGLVGGLAGSLAGLSTMLRTRKNSSGSLASQDESPRAGEPPTAVGPQLAAAWAEISSLRQQATQSAEAAAAAEQARAVAEAAQQEAAEQLTAADREQELLEGQLEQLTASLQHECSRKSALETQLQQYEQDKGFSEALLTRLRNQTNAILSETRPGVRRGPGHIGAHPIDLLSARSLNESEASTLLCSPPDSPHACGESDSPPRHDHARNRPVDASAAVSVSHSNGLSRSDTSAHSPHKHDVSPAGQAAGGLRSHAFTSFSMDSATSALIDQAVIPAHGGVTKPLPAHRLPDAGHVASLHGNRAGSDGQTLSAQPRSTQISPGSNASGVQPASTQSSPGSPREQPSPSKSDIDHIQGSSAHKAPRAPVDAEWHSERQ